MDRILCRNYRNYFCNCCVFILLLDIRNNFSLEHTPRLIINKIILKKCQNLGFAFCSNELRYSYCPCSSENYTTMYASSTSKDSSYCYCSTLHCKRENNERICERELKNGWGQHPFLYMRTKMLKSI